MSEPSGGEPWGPTDTQTALALCRWLDSLLTSWEGSSEEAAEHMASAIVAGVGPEVERAGVLIERLRADVREEGRMRDARAIVEAELRAERDRLLGENEQLVLHLSREQGMCSAHEREAARLRERCSLLESASPDLAGVALDHRAPADRSEQGRRP